MRIHDMAVRDTGHSARHKNNKTQQNNDMMQRCNDAMTKRYNDASKRRETYHHGEEERAEVKNSVVFVAKSFLR
jgi:hypothetical protein